MKRLLLAVITVFACARLVQADIIYKKDGEKIEGTVTGAVVDSQVGIQTPNKMYYVKQSEIDRIEYAPKALKDPGPDWNVIIATTAFCLLAFLLVMAGRSI